MLSDPLKKLIALAATAGLLFLAYYGSYLPMRKSQSFIAGMRSLEGVQSIQEFDMLFTAILDLPSPIGYEELVRHLSGSITPFLGVSQNASATPPLVGFIEERFKPILARGKGMSFSQNLFVLGNIYQSAFIRTGSPEYLDKAKAVYVRGLELAPHRPQFLFGLFDVYRLMGDTRGVLETKDKILALWPDDDRVQAAADEFIQRITEFEKVHGPVMPTNIMPLP